LMHTDLPLFDYSTNELSFVSNKHTNSLLLVHNYEVNTSDEKNSHKNMNKCYIAKI
jgi:hypothetical protein